MVGMIRGNWASLQGVNFEERVAWFSTLCTVIALIIFLVVNGDTAATICRLALPRNDRLAATM